MKLTVVSNVSNIEEYKKIGADAFIFGLKNYCSGYYNSLSLEEIKKLREDYDGELFIAINKNIFNEELKELEEALIFLDKIHVDGVLFYDLSILYIKRRLNLALPLVWNQTHMVTNYNSCNYYYNKGVEYGVVASEITLEEVNELNNKTNMKLFLNVLGYQVMSYSRRNLVDNFFKSIGKVREKESYIIKNNGEDYLINQEDNGACLFSHKVLNGSVVISNTQVDYVILNDMDIPHDVFTKCLCLFRKLIDTKDEKFVKEIDSLIGEDRGFFFNKTIYKVKKND